MNDETPVLRADAADDDLQDGPVSKTDWIHYAMSKGEPKARAVKMTLSELREKYAPAEYPVSKSAGNPVHAEYEAYENGEGGWSYRLVSGK